MGRLVNIHHQVKRSGVYNFQGCRVHLPSNFNFDFIERELWGYHDYAVMDMLKYGFPVDCRLVTADPGIPDNHKGATEFKLQVQQQLDKEVKLGGILGPFVGPPFSNPRYSPLNSIPKKDSIDRRLILDLSFPHGSAINDGIDKDSYLGETQKLTLPSLDEFVSRVVALGRTVKMFKVDLARGYKQMYIDPLDFEKMGFTFEGQYYFDCTLSMGSRSSTRCCQQITSAVVYIYILSGDILLLIT